MSANSAVTVLRSPSAASASTGVSDATRIGEASDTRTVDARAVAASALPQSPQNFFSSGLSAPHWAHRFASAAPQSPQNRLPAGFSVPHFTQRIGHSSVKSNATAQL